MRYELYHGHEFEPEEMTFDELRQLYLILQTYDEAAEPPAKFFAAARTNHDKYNQKPVWKDRNKQPYCRRAEGRLWHHGWRKHAWETHFEQHVLVEKIPICQASFIIDRSLPTIDCWQTIDSCRTVFLKPGSSIQSTEPTGLTLWQGQWWITSPVVIGAWRSDDNHWHFLYDRKRVPHHLKAQDSTPPKPGFVWLIRPAQFGIDWATRYKLKQIWKRYEPTPDPSTTENPRPHSPNRYRPAQKTVAS